MTGVLGMVEYIVLEIMWLCRLKSSNYQRLDEASRLFSIQIGLDSDGAVIAIE